jgi:hypothetical protein
MRNGIFYNSIDHGFDHVINYSDKISGFVR